jgi:predicted Ser/Thr protein kinase
MSAHAGDERLGPYRLKERLGEGGMGVVYLALDPSGQSVAIKVLREGIASEDTARKRLAHEVETMRRVMSPNVAEVIDADVTCRTPYIVTQYVPGRTLEDVVLQSGPLSGAPLARLAAGLAGALAAVHAAGVVHRDLKPANVMMVSGEPVVIDFGIAQAADSTRLTLTGMFMGTPGYLAPEVIEGKQSGPAADVHSWGATLSFAATGRPPFGTGTFEAIFYRIVHGQPDLAGMPAPLVPLVLSALARDPAKRPAAADLASGVGALDPVVLVPGPAAPAAALAPGTQAPRTSPDLSLPAGVAMPLGAAVPGMAAAATAAPAPPGSARWPGTRPMPVSQPADFAGQLPPVRYGTPAAPAAAGNGRVRARGNGQPEVAAAALGAGVPVPALAPDVGVLPASGSQSARRPLVVVTVIALIALSVALPIAGTAIVLAVLACLRAADLTGLWALRRSRSQGAAAIAFYPWALVRSAVRFVMLAPMALLCAAAAAAVAIMAVGPADLARVGGWAAGALVACYSLGPGSAGCRRPLGQFYGALTRSSFGAVLAFVSLTALATVAVAAAASLMPGYWPVAHVGYQLQHASLSHHTLLGQLPGDLSKAGKSFVSWLGKRL